MRGLAAVCSGRNLLPLTGFLQQLTGFAFSQFWALFGAVSVSLVLLAAALVSGLILWLTTYVTVMNNFASLLI